MTIGVDGPVGVKVVDLVVAVVVGNSSNVVRVSVEFVVTWWSLSTLFVFGLIGCIL